MYCWLQWRPNADPLVQRLIFTSRSITIHGMTIIWKTVNMQSFAATWQRLRSKRVGTSLESILIRPPFGKSTRGHELSGIQQSFARLWINADLARLAQINNGSRSRQYSSATPRQSCRRSTTSDVLSTPINRYLDHHGLIHSQSGHGNWPKDSSREWYN